jgi:hypothetical protein
LEFDDYGLGPKRSVVLIAESAISGNLFTPASAYSNRREPRSLQYPAKEQQRTSLKVRRRKDEDVVPCKSEGTSRSV